MKTVITGASSFIGRAIVEMALKDGAKVYALSHNPPELKRQFGNRDNLCLINYDFNNNSNINEKIEDGVFYHLAWAGTDKAGRNHPIVQEKNIGYTLEAVQLAIRLRCTKFIFVGSQAEYGNGGFKMGAETQCNPKTSYGICKYAAEKLSRIICADAGLVFGGARVFFVYGPGDRSESMINYACHNLIEDRDIYISNGHRQWDYLYYKDAAKILYLVGKNIKESSILPVAYGKSFPIASYVNEIVDTVGCDRRLVHYLDRDFDYDLIADTHDTDRVTGFYDKTTFEEGIKMTVRAFKNTLM